MFSAFGAGGLFGPWLAPRLMRVVEQVPYEVMELCGQLFLRTDEVGSYFSAFALSGVLCLLSAVLVLRLPPSPSHVLVHPFARRVRYLE